MNGPEHYAEAERLLEGVAKAQRKLKKSGVTMVAPGVAHSIEEAFKIAVAQAGAHATLALVAATAEGRYTEYNNQPAAAHVPESVDAVPKDSSV